MSENPSLLYELTKKERWEEFLEKRRTKSHLPQRVIEEFEKFIENREYENISKALVAGIYEFSIPRKRQINKTKAGKKRDVYTYTKEETIVLKMISYLMHSYDHLFSSNLYSFRSSQGVKKALHDLKCVKNLNKMYGYKADIRNYFNSVNVNILLKRLEPELKDDRELYGLFEKLLSNPYVTFRNEVIEEKKGIMAGVPLSAFLANFYLKDLDHYFSEKNAAYMRYADDIIVFSESSEELNEYKNKISSFLSDNYLSINKEKEFNYEPGERFEFLGFSIENGTVDISYNTIRKIKGKIKRASRSIRRWASKKQASGDVSLRTMIKKFDMKFYGKGETELSWKYWFFPTINTDAGLKIVDEYMQERLRYVVTGRYSKKNFDDVPYERLKECGYRSLVNEFYAGRK